MPVSVLWSSWSAKGLLPGSTSTMVHYGECMQFLHLLQFMSWIACYSKVIWEIWDYYRHIDSGAAGNFIDENFTKSHDIPLYPCATESWVSGLLEGETNHPMQQVLHRHLLEIHIPKDHQSCHCSSRTTHSPNLPPEYSDLTDTFSKTKAAQLPPHHPSDCAIELLPDTTPPRGRILPLSQSESKVMKSYINEELTKGFIRPWTFSTSAKFFSVNKKDDYHGLNKTTVKFLYPLPLVPAVLQQLCMDRYYTKLDLCSAYKWDEWKTAFITSTGHYEYIVMSFRLFNSPTVFHAFFNDVFRDMLNHWIIIIYIDKHLREPCRACLNHPTMPHYSSAICQGWEVWVPSDIDILSRLCDQSWEHSDGVQQDKSSVKMATTHHD